MTDGVPILGLGADAPGDRVEKILDVTRDLFVDYGVRITTKDIADHAGIGRTTLFRNIGGKDKIIRLMIEREVGHIMRRLRCVSETASDPTDAVVNVMAAILQLSQSHPFARRALRIDTTGFIAIGLHGPSSAIDPGFALLSDLIRDGQNAGTIRSDDAPAHMASVLLYIAIGYALAPLANSVFSESAALKEAQTIVLPFLRP